MAKMVHGYLKHCMAIKTQFPDKKRFHFFFLINIFSHYEKMEMNLQKRTKNKKKKNKNKNKNKATFWRNEMGKEAQKNLWQPNQKPFVGVLLLVILPFSPSYPLKLSF